jgi:drug/metabolite transporter (DMT)-like permease
MGKSPIFEYVLLLLATMIWGGNFVVGKATTAYFPPVTLACLRWSLAFLVFLPISWKRMKRDWDIIGKHKWALLCMSVTGISGYNSLIYIALNYTAAINAAVINSITPVFIAAFSFIFLKERLKQMHIYGIVFSIAGILFTLSKGSWKALLTFRFNIGDLLIISAAVSWSLYTILLNKYANILPKYSTFSFTMLIGVITLAFCSFFEMLNPAVIIVWNINFIFILAYVGILVSVIAFLAWNAAIEKVGATSAGIFYNLIPFFSSIFSVFLLKESLAWYQITGGSLVILGVLISTFKMKAKVSRVDANDELIY